jgi:hypothetical protein
MRPTRPAPRVAGQPSGRRTLISLRVPGRVVGALAAAADAANDSGRRARLPFSRSSLRNLRWCKRRAVAV